MSAGAIVFLVAAIRPKPTGTEGRPLLPDGYSLTPGWAWMRSMSILTPLPSKAEPGRDLQQYLLGRIGGRGGCWGHSIGGDWGADQEISWWCQSHFSLSALSEMEGSCQWRPFTETRILASISPPATRCESCMKE